MNPFVALARLQRRQPKSRAEVRALLDEVDTLRADLVSRRDEVAADIARISLSLRAVHAYAGLSRKGRSR
jgi:hypothetical protein